MMNENSKQAPTLQVLDSGGRYSFPMDDVVRFGQVMPNSPVQAAMDNRLAPGQAQGQYWPPHPFAHDPNRTVGGYEPYRPYPGFGGGQFPDPADQYSGNHTSFPPMRYQEVNAKPDPLMSGNHLLCLDDGMNYPISEARAASLPPFSSITAQSLPPRPQSAVKEDQLRGFDEGLGARLSGGNNTPSHNEFGEGLQARLMERGSMERGMNMQQPSREENYTPPVQYRPWEAPAPVRVSSRSQSENSQTPPSSSGNYPPEKREEDNGGDSRSSWYRAKSSDSGSYSKEPNLISLDKPQNEMNAQHKDGTGNNNNVMPNSAGGGGENHIDTPVSTYSTLTKVPPQYPPQHGREDPASDITRLPFPPNSFGYFHAGLAPPLSTGWDYRNDMPMKGLAGPGDLAPMDSKYPLVPPPVRPGDLQNMPHQFIDERQMRTGGGPVRQHHHPAAGGGPYCQNGNDGGGYKAYPSMNEHGHQSPGMHNPPNTHSFSGNSGGLHGGMKDLEPGLKGGDKHLASSTTAKSEGRGTKNQHSAGGDETGEKKPKKQKRKRCGECLGCQRKDNCGECAPCRNDKSHQICKMRRCEKLIERKVSGPLSNVEPVANKLECPDQSREPGWW